MITINSITENPRTGLRERIIVSASHVSNVGLPVVGHWHTVIRTKSVIPGLGANACGSEMDTAVGHARVDAARMNRLGQGRVALAGRGLHLEFRHAAEGNDRGPIGIGAIAPGAR